MLPGNYTCKPPEKLPPSESPWDAAEGSWGDVQQLCCVLGSSHPITWPVHQGRGFIMGTEHAFACCTPFWGQGERGGTTRYPNISNSQCRSPPRNAASSPSAHGAKQSARGCAGDDRLCTDVHYMIIIIILPRIRDERDDYDGYKEALVSRGF